MKINSIVAIFDALNRSGTHYLVAGGLAVVAYGYLRLTMDIDIILKLQPDNIRRALNALRSLGYRPRVPVLLEDFADPEHRRQWIENKGMVVFQLVSDAHKTAPIDIFVQEPFDFDSVYERAPSREIDRGVSIRVVPLAELLVMKEKANRPKDQIDLIYLRKLQMDAQDA
ncbi:MAG: nucleotidyl transferase AbiEii/AbiGii toxin family protein [Kiritimatiellae bacterium]|nr:nucleotidyl transferase AbiEii/AbiGii toxin family protein [Kiritimatiellia bacterium]MDW8459528.1 hypothetical protein [Verrucomicrobiota bacterium]